MPNNDILKQYSINIDFLNYEKKKDVTKNIVYSKGDVDTAFIQATLTIGNKIIDLEGCTVTVNIKNNEGKSIVNYCDILDVKTGTILIPFTTDALAKSGFNKFEVVITSNGKQIVSPMLDYRVADNISDEDSILGTNEYSVLVVLIDQVQNILKDTKETEGRVNILEDIIISNEEIREKNEAIRIANESTRQSQEVDRQNIFNEKISVIDDRVDLVDRKLISVDEIIASKLVSVDNDVRDIINIKFDNKVIEIKEEIDITINQKADEAFVNANNKINDKIDEMSESINNVNLKIQEMDSTIDENVDKVDRKISEINSTKDNLVNTVNTTVNNKISEIDATKKNLVDTVDNKIKEVDTVKNDLTSAVNNKISEVNITKDNLVITVDNKIIELENRFNELETADISGEVIKARECTNGIIHETIGKRLDVDFSKKADIDNVYSREEIDNIIEEFTLVDDNVTNDKNTWSSYKINEELNFIKSNIESKVLENATNILKLQEQLGNSINFLNDFINVIKGDATFYNLDRLSDGISVIKKDIDKSIENSNKG